MEKVNDKSFGCVPIFKSANKSEFLFGLVQHDEKYFNFPKGHPENNETIEETIKREAYEEAQLTNIQLDMNKEFVNSYVFEKNNQEIHKTVILYIGYVNEITSSASKGFETEIINVVWLTKEEAMEKLTYDASKDILKQVCEYLNI